VGHALDDRSHALDPIASTKVDKPGPRQPQLTA
jgi:hypothetical protein